MVVPDPQTARGVSCSGSRPVTESENPGDVLAAKRLHNCVSSCFGRLEIHGDSSIAPGIFELVASISDIDKVHAELAGGVFKTPRLVAELPGKEQQAFGRMRHSWCVSM